MDESGARENGGARLGRGRIDAAQPRFPALSHAAGMSPLSKNEGNAAEISEEIGYEAINAGEHSDDAELIGNPL